MLSLHISQKEVGKVSYIWALSCLLVAVACTCFSE